jgi:MoaA/NifB/PqqE/SkfB family radical SAM enzyme
MKGNVAQVLSEAVRDECLSIEVTTYCDGDCLHCFALTGVSKRSSLCVDVVKEAVREGYNSAYRRLHITGGEPLLWEGLFTALDYAFGIGYRKITLNTNGRFLTEDVAGRFAAYPGLSISVSLEGPEALHDRIRGDGSYKRTVAGIDKALEAGVDLAIFTVAGKSLLSILPHFVDEIYQKFPGIKYLTLIQLIAAIDNGFALKEELLGPEEFIQLVQTAGLLNLAGLRTNLKNSPLARVVSKLIDMPWVPPTYPLYREGSIIVMANGNISLAHSSRQSLGQYAPGMIQKVLSSDEYRRSVAPDLSTCSSCKYTDLCKENGMLRPAARHMDLQPEVPYCKRVLDRIAG